MSKPLLKPLQGWRGSRILVTQPLGQLCREVLGQRVFRTRQDVDLERLAFVPRDEHGIRHGVRIVAGDFRSGDLVRQASQVLDQHDAQVIAMAQSSPIVSGWTRW